MTVPWEEAKPLFFKAAADSPASWLMSAYWLHKAAKRCDHEEHPDEEDLRFLGGVRRMLVGLSMELLLKGILITDDMRVLKDDGSVQKEFATHDLKRLASRSSLSFDPEECRVLSVLESCVTWAGRYPIPKKESDYDVVMYSNIDREIEDALWERLFAHLLEVAWVTDILGRRKPLPRREEE